MRVNKSTNWLTKLIGNRYVFVEGLVFYSSLMQLQLYWIDIYIILKLTKDNELRGESFELRRKTIYNNIYYIVDYIRTLLIMNERS